MKKLLLSLCAVTAMVCALVSCGGAGAGAKHATVINLPDSALVGQSLPKVDGTLADYISIDPQAYSINLTDSVLSLTVKIAVNKAYSPNKYVDASIGNPDSLAYKMPYLVLVDSIGAPVGNFYMVMDSTKVADLMSLIKGKVGEVAEFTFTSLSQLTPEQCDSLAMAAFNFNLIGNLNMKVDEKAVNAIMNQLAGAYSYYHAWCVSDAGGCDPVYQAKARSRLASALATAKPVVPYMNEAQKAKYRSYGGR